MTVKLFLTLMIGGFAFNFFNLPVFAQIQPTSTASPHPSIEALPDGEYFYGEVSRLHQPGSRSIIFQKTGDEITGYEYRQNHDGDSCFQGTVTENRVAITTAATLKSKQQPDRDWEFSSGGNLDFTELSRIPEIPAYSQQRLKQCFQILAPNPDPKTSILLEKQGSLEVGDLVLSSDDSLYDEYTIQGQAGQSITITLESPDFDTYIALFDAENNLIADNDDMDSSSSNSALTMILPKTGTYRIWVNGYDKASRGQYTLKVIRK